jgi:hypothetical protein
MLSTTAAFIPSAQALVDDFDSHCTRVGGRTIPHKATPGPEIPAGTMIFFDDRLPAPQKVSLRPRGKIIYYERPAVPSIKGLEKAQPMGIAPEYLTQESDPRRPAAAAIEFVRVTANGPVLAGLYHPTGTVNLNSKIEKDKRIDTKQLTCRTGQDDGLRFNFEYKEFIHHIPYSFSFIKGCLIKENPKAPTALPCFTFSCWVLPVRQGHEIFSWSYAAPEPEFKGKKKRLAFGIDPVTNKAVHRAFLKSSLVETKDKIITPAVTKIIAKKGDKYTEEKVITGVIHVPTRGNEPIANKDVAKRLGFTLEQLRAIRQGTLKPSNVKLSKAPAKGRDGTITGYNYTYSKTVTESKVYKADKIGILKPAQKFPETTKTLKEDLKFSSEFPTSASSWIHLVLSVDARNKSMKVHFNDKEIFTVKNPSIISLNQLCWLQIGDPRYLTQGLLADINLANGQNLNPAAFCNITSQGVLMPKSFAGPFGPNGFQLRGNHELDFRTRNVLDTSPNKTQWKAEWGANGSVSFKPKSPTTL